MHGAHCDHCAETQYAIISNWADLTSRNKVRKRELLIRTINAVCNKLLKGIGRIKVKTILCGDLHRFNELLKFDSDSFHITL